MVLSLLILSSFYNGIWWVRKWGARTIKSFKNVFRRSSPIKCTHLLTNSLTHRPISFNLYSVHENSCLMAADRVACGDEIWHCYWKWFLLGSKNIKKKKAKTKYEAHLIWAARTHHFRSLKVFLFLNMMSPLKVILMVHIRVSSLSLSLSLYPKLSIGT